MSVSSHVSAQGEVSILQPPGGPSPGPGWDLRLQPAELWEMEEFLLKSHPVHGAVLPQAERNDTRLHKAMANSKSWVDGRVEE